MRLRSTRAACWLAVVASGCFSDAPPLTDEGTTTAGASCAVGSEGCFCTEGQACDAGLECLLPAGVCVAEGCTPGSGLCTCDAGTCADDYKCVENFCAPQDSATISDTGSADSTPADDDGGTGATSGAGDTTTSGVTAVDSGPMSTGEVGSDPTDVTVSTDASDATAESSTASEPPQTCGECIEAAKLDPCDLQWNACANCDPWVECFADMLGDCCAEAQPPTNWTFFANCVDMMCAVPCGGSIQCEI